MQKRDFKVGVVLSYNDFATVGRVAIKVRACSVSEASREAEIEYARRCPSACILIEEVIEITK